MLKIKRSNVWEQLELLVRHCLKSQQNPNDTEQHV